MSRVMLDTRLLRITRYVLGESADLMQIAEEITRGAFYVCWRDGANLRIGGTGFFVAILSSPLDQMGAYVVTAAHIIENIKKRHKRDVWLLMNGADGERIHLKFPLDKWFYHPTEPTVDVAVADWMLGDTDARTDHTMLQSEMAVTPRDHTEQGIREGTDVFMTGVFTEHSGRKRVIPILRMGNIALMPSLEEPVYLPKRGGSIEAYLVECRSMSGLSGSPAFAAINKIVPPMIPTPPGFIAVENYKAEIRALWAWIGLVHGHWDIDETDLTMVQDSTSQRKAEPLNTGIAVVVPAWKVMEVINQPRLVEMRKKRWGDLRAKHGPTEDDSGTSIKSPTQPTHAPNPKDRIDIPIPTRGQFERALTKATRRKKPS